MTGRPGAEAHELDPRALPLASEAVLERGDDGRHHVRYRLPIPYFAFAWAPLVRRRARRVEEAADAGRRLPVDVPWWAPPVPQDSRATATVACLCLIGAVSSYGGGTGGLLTQTLPYAAKVYDVGNATLGTGLAIVRREGRVRRTRLVAAPLRGAEGTAEKVMLWITIAAWLGRADQKNRPAWRVTAPACASHAA